MSKGCELSSQGPLNISCRLQRNPFSQMFPSKRQYSAGEASGRARELGLVHGLHLVAFIRWDVQQLTSRTKETGSKGFRYLQWHRGMVVQTWYHLHLAGYQKRIKLCFVFRRFLLVNRQIWCYLIIHKKHYKLYVVLGARCICSSVYSWQYSWSILEFPVQWTEKQNCNFHAWPSASHSPTFVVS